MNYYDDEEEYLYNYGYRDIEDQLTLIEDDCPEYMLADTLFRAGLIPDKTTRYTGSMEKLVFLLGNENEVYSQQEIHFIESVGIVYVYSDFLKKLQQGTMACRTIAARFYCDKTDALRECISFEKIINKALDGFNIFFFVTNDTVFLGGKLFAKSSKKDCILSNPIRTESQLENFMNELMFISDEEEFFEYYRQFCQLISFEQDARLTYEEKICQRRGPQFSYLYGIDDLQRRLDVDLTYEIHRYKQSFEDTYETPSFSALLEEVEESLAFIKSNRINTYELLFEADEMLRQANEAEAANEQMLQTIDHNEQEDSPSDEEAKRLLDDPEEVIKLLKKRRGI